MLERHSASIALMGPIRRLRACVFVAAAASLSGGASLAACGSETPATDAGAADACGAPCEPAKDASTPVDDAAGDAALEDGGRDSAPANDSGRASDASQSDAGIGAGLAASLQASCAISATGAVKCWGYAAQGKLGLGDTANRGDDPNEMGSSLPPVALGAGRTARQVVMGSAHTCALLDDGSVKCWGTSGLRQGQTGLGEIGTRGDGPGEMGDTLPAVALGAGRKAVALAAGFAHTCALLDDSQVKCWGDNELGQLGLGDTAARGDEPGEMGAALPAVRLGTGRTAKQIAAGAQFTCAILDDDRVKCWGDNSQGELGLGDTTRRGRAPSEMGDGLPFVSLGTGRTARQLACGGHHVCVRLDDGSVKCWGDGLNGQLGLGDTRDRGDGPGEMGNSLPALALGSGRTVVDLRAGFSHTCARLDDGRLKCWGYNDVGQLGLGDKSDRGTSAAHMGDALPAVLLGTGRTALGLALGNGHTCASLDDGTVKCWGGNNSGELGQGNKLPRGGAPNELGDALRPVSLW